MTTKVTDKNISNIANKFVQWQSVITADGSTATNATAGQGYFIDTTSNTHTINLPSSASIGDSVAIKDYAGTFATNNLTIARNGHNIQGVANDSLISSARAGLTLVYVDSTRGWVYSKESNVANLGTPLFLSATGGTITTSGDLKIHTFTGDGCFVVTSLGGGATPCAEATKVSYMVIAGAGGGGSNYAGGGGAGGFREGKVSGDPYSASPIVAPDGLTVTASPTTYPITVGAGGAGGSSNARGASGSNSIFSTITSAGGGGGGNATGGIQDGLDGGSGGGVANDGNPFPAPLGNVRTTDPVQGFNGGLGRANPSFNGAGGGGGATAVGGNGGCGSTSQGPGGAGATNSITNSPVAYAGGGGGGGQSGVAGAPGGAGGGGAGGGATSNSPGNPTGTGTNGTANTGGGGGGGSCGTQTGGTGGSGIVIIRYKFQ